MVTGLRSTNCREARASSAPSVPHTWCTSFAGRSAVTASPCAPSRSRTIRSPKASACGSRHHSATKVSARGHEPTKALRAAKRRHWVSRASSSNRSPFVPISERTFHVCGARLQGPRVATVHKCTRRYKGARERRHQAIDPPRQAAIRDARTRHRPPSA